MKTGGWREEPRTQKPPSWEVVPRRRRTEHGARSTEYGVPPQLRSCEDLGKVEVPFLNQLPAGLVRYLFVWVGWMPAPGQGSRAA